MTWDDIYTTSIIREKADYMIVQELHKMCTNIQRSLEYNSLKLSATGCFWVVELKMDFLFLCAFKMFSTMIMNVY